MILETRLQGTIPYLTPEADTALLGTARIFEVARRTAYERLNEGLERDDLCPSLRDCFRMDACFARDAILEAEANRATMREFTQKHRRSTTPGNMSGLVDAPSSGVSLDPRKVYPCGTPTGYRFLVELARVLPASWLN
jgi:hypothetical protein